MSIHINVGGMNYNQLSCAERAEIDKKRKNRLAQVRQQSKEIAQLVRVKVQCEKENQLKKLQEIKKRELEKCKKRQQCQIQQEYESCLTDFGAAHIAACEASCEENETLFQKREEYDLMAAQRGRSAMLQEQRKRDRAAEERLAKKKRKNLKNASVQADIVTRRDFGTNHDVQQENVSEGASEEDENENARIETFTNKRNLHKSSNYNPKNFTSNSVESSNNFESEEIETSSEQESDEFNQITNLLKQKIYERDQDDFDKKSDDPIELTDSSEEEEQSRQVVNKPKPQVLKKKSILKKVRSPVKTSRKVKETDRSNKIDQGDKRVKYVDLSNKYTTSYTPRDDLITENHAKTTNARVEAKKQNKAVVNGVSSDVLKQLTEIRSKEALEKEKTRRDYERLRLELDEVAKQEKEAKEAAEKCLRNISTTLLEKHEKARKERLEQAVENAMKRNIISCPLVDSNERKVCEVNVADVRKQIPSTSSYLSGVQEPKKENRSKTNDEINNIVKVEKLKDLLERINHQKKLLLSEIEKSEDIPGPDLDNVMKCLEKLEKEKSSLNVQSNKQKETEDLVAREAKIKEREKRFEDRIRELYKKQKAFLAASDEKKKKEESSDSSEQVVVAPPVEIIIKVHQKSPRSSKFRKSFRCIDTLNREPGKAYPKTPRKVSRSMQHDEDLPTKPDPVKVPQETQTSPLIFAATTKPILKKTQQAGTSTKATSISKQSEDSSQSVSTSYQSLPEKINVAQAVPADSHKNHHKLNPVLMHYITRLLGMNQNIANQLSVSVSSVPTPGSSTINSSGNNGSANEAQVPSFDQKRLEKLQEFINDNYSFLSEVNETLERSQLEEQNEENILKVDGVWRDVLRNKKPQSESNNNLGKSDGKSSNPTKQRSSATSKSVPSQNAFKPPKSASLQTSAPLKLTRPTQPVRIQQTSQRPLQHTQVKRQQERKENQPTLQRPQSANTTRPQPTATTRPQTGKPTKPQITQQDMLNVTKYLESHMLNNFAEYTANCQKRISDLAQTMERVRQEKLKLIENSLSSGEFGHFTEYKEIVVPGKTHENPTTSASDLKDSPSLREDPPSEEINNILQKQTRPFGVSKDSGISLLSRPVTSSDFRDSPDVRVTSEERENTFQPILKDIPKPKMKITAVDGASETIKDVSLLIKEHDEKTSQKKQKPPLSLNRFSPNLEKPHEAHELSTIAEVETPTASKVNLLEKVQEVGVENLASFPEFEDYAKNLLTVEPKPSEPSFLSLGAINKILDEIKLQSFTNPQEYAIQELSSMHADENDNGDTQSEASSIIDIASELQRRQIITKPFQCEADAENNNMTPMNSTNAQQAVRLKSPQRPPALSRIGPRTPENMEIEFQTTTPTKNRPFVEPPPQPNSPKSNDTLSGIQEIEREPQGDDLQGMGLNWATSMFKRDNESKKLESSSSSTSMEKGKSIQIEVDVGRSSTCERSSSSSSSSIGQPMNLREFLARELAKKSRVEKSFSDESSLSSQFMRSLLKANNSNNSSASKSGESDERVRTSTPLQPRGSSLTAQRTGTNNMFAGESLSTLKGSESESSEKSDKPSGDDHKRN